MYLIHRTAICLLGLTTAFSLALAACQPVATPTQPDPDPEQGSPTAVPRSPTRTPAPTPLPDPTSTTPPPTEEQPASLPAYGPSDFPENINPLTGLPVDDPSILDRRPLLIKVSNESPEVRPQSGLSFADHVWEYQMEGWGQTRFTAVYLSQSPQRVGSVRSARLIDTEVLVPMYDGLLVISGASVGIYQILQNAPWWNRVFREEIDKPHLVRIRDIPREGTDYYHALFAIPDRVWEAARERGVYERESSLEGLAFDYAVPSGGIPTAEAIVDYPRAGALHRWRYDPESGKWLSSTEDQRAVVLEMPDLDLLTGKQLAFDNVIILYAEHYLADFIEDQPNQLLAVGIRLEGEGAAFVLRDGRRYEATWRRDGPQAMIQFFDANGSLIPLKPGNVWFSTSTLPTDDYPAEVSFSP